MFEEMERYVDEVRTSDYYSQQEKQLEWEAQQRAKAPAILGILRRHLPAEALQEAEEFLSTGFGCDCFYEALRRDLTRKKLQQIFPADRWGEIEQYLDTGMFMARGHDEIRPISQNNEGSPAPKVYTVTHGSWRRRLRRRRLNKVRRGQH